MGAGGRGFKSPLPDSAPKRKRPFATVESRAGAGYCRLCRAEYKQAHYQANKARYVKNAMARRERVHMANLRNLVEYFKTHPCVDCGESDPLVLEFDHLRDKAYTVSQAMMDKTWEAILVEIAKCQVVCANCHRRRTLLRGGYRRTRV